ncbi:TIGR02099 family protein [Paraglaciecola aquimarina]|uniref:TIGR02099 family protein n=1 Tax=Paraglaciecola algarum TaxID=3050085 RepID=A0ABS9D357_9ALTE|nr:TIGR02099 family protein [Paraglaciecola sp. G1-23]
MKKESKSASFYVAYVVKKLWTFIALSLVVIAVALSVVRYSLPYMNDQKHYLEQWLSQQVGADIYIGTITAKWQGVGPAIVLEDLELAQTGSSPVKLKINETSIEVDFWQSVLAKQIQANKFDLEGLELTLELTSLGQDESEYPIVEALEKLFLQQLQLFSISDSKIILNTPQDQQVVLIDQVSWVNKDQHHQGVGQLQIEEIAKNSSSFILDLHGDLQTLNGTFYAKGEEVDLSPWVEQWLVTSHELVESRGSFVMWAAIGNNKVDSVQLDLSNSRFAWNTRNGDKNGEIKAEIIDGQISASPKQQDWLFNLDNLNLQINDRVINSDWLAKISKSGDLLLQQDKKIKLSPLIDLLPLVLNQQNLASISALQPEAELTSLLLNRNESGEITINATISDIGWQQTSYLPGMQGIDAEINWHKDNGLLSLKSKAGILSINQILPEDIPYQRFFTDLYLSSSDKNFTVTTDNALFKSDPLTFSPHLFYDSQDQYLTFSAKIEKLDVASLDNLYPTNLMGEQTRAYLIESLLGGQISAANLLWHGKLNAFPFAQNQGVFQANVKIKQGQLKFAPQWPALTELDIDLLFENQSLYMTSQQGKLLDVDLINMSAKIPKLANNAILNIDAKAKALGQEVTDLMLESNLADTLGHTLQQVQISGPIETELNLHIPLSGNQVVAKGKAYLSSNQVKIPSLDISLEQANGVAEFNNDLVKFSDMQAMLLKQPVLISFDGAQQEQGYQAKINLSGDWQITPLLEDYYSNLLPYLNGHSQWDGQVDLTLIKDGYIYSAAINSELKNLASNLPTPFAKTAQELMYLSSTIQGNQQASSINIKLGDKIEFNGNLPHQDMQFSRAHLAIGDSDIVGMGLGFSVSAKLPNIDTGQWYRTINSLISDLPESVTSQDKKPLLEAPKRIFISADNAIVASQKLTDLDVVAKNTSDSWLLDINAKQARMEIAIYKEWLNKGVNINADFIQLAKWQTDETPAPPKNKAENNNQFSADLDSLPPINFSCARCRYLDHDLGKVDFSLTRAATGMRINKIRLKNDYGLFNGEGDWFLVKNKSSTRLKGDFSSTDFGAFLKGFNFNSGIKDSEAAASFDISWQRAPYEFNFESLNGQIDWRLSDGYLTEVTDKGSRIFSLLSLESLVRKLTLDFRDVFAKGFFYNKIDGSFQLQNGVADTQDTIVDGGAGEITMRGYTDLTAQQLNYQIEFAPKVTSSLPVIVAWMVNPATALAALAIDQVLTSAKVISNIKFSLTGTLDDPQLKELGRDSKEISLPAKTKPTPEPQGEPDLFPVDSKLIEPVNLQVPAQEPING